MAYTTTNALIDFEGCDSEPNKMFIIFTKLNKLTHWNKYIQGKMTQKSLTLNLNNQNSVN